MYAFLADMRAFSTMGDASLRMPVLHIAGHRAEGCLNKD